MDILYFPDLLHNYRLSKKESHEGTRSDAAGVGTIRNNDDKISSLTTRPAARWRGEGSFRSYVQTW
jgi:hypothetical protein